MRAWLVSSVVLVLGVVVGGCSGGDCSGNASCLSPDGGDAGADVAADVGPDVPPGCDLSADISASPACIDDGIAVFVDGTSGADTNPGTKASPFKTIAKAIGAAGAKPRVYICAGTYAEDVSLTQTNAVGLFGGLACGTWTYDGSQPIVGKSSLALHVDGVVKPIVVSDITFEAAAGANAGDSSIAAFVNASADVTLRRVKLRPAAGKDGAAGTTGHNWTTVAPSDASIAGKDASGATGGGDHTCSICADSVNSTGGGGGTGGTLSSTGGKAGTPNLNGTPPADGAGGAHDPCTAGHNGANASPATAALGATTVGKLTASGWTTSNGQDGPNGGPGQGGGGGGGGTAALNPGGGGGGGCGGCGGSGGKGGGGGGASIGLASVASSVKLVSCDIVTLAGGAGGAGSAGQDGQPGGYAGAAVSPGCAGGNGGQGGAGAASGGGAGGISIGVVYTDQEPAIDQATTIVVPGTAATKGAGGQAGVNDGVDGLAQATFQASST